ncbi:long-chain fatty acid transport protein 1-like [Cimex lectularius]|uniref:Very long-chain fatty acid transport protein n=1 Tax=Cimex lectularius TaxID=79782 RepID=A0A8I6RCZ0_CIMLE|nr:long-chain fatty acid transport protein 1-like [Cimex lectularius]
MECSTIFLCVFLLLSAIGLLQKKKLATFFRDMHLVLNVGYVIISQKWYEYKNETIIDVFQRVVAKDPEKVALRHLDESWTFWKLEELSNRISRVFDSMNYSKGDCIALMMDGCPDYVACILGVVKNGGITALVNINQNREVLRRSIETTNAKALIYGTNYTEVISEIASSLKVDFYHVGEGMAVPGSNDLKSISENFPSTPMVQKIKARKHTEPLLYIFTSGTTGLPKAAIITHARYFMMTLGVKHSFGIKKEDVVYTSLPLYHTAGVILGVGQALLGGSTVVIRSKFSATNFFSDCIKYKCTVAQYIGEICRYILCTPESEVDCAHSVRLMFGNGLRAEVWEQFVKRFGVKQIGEFYGSTEGNANIINAWNKIGAVGYVPWFARRFHSAELVLVNEETKEPLRNSQGFCQKCKPGQPGIFIAKISKSKVTSHFNGYVDKEATKKKILENVFEKGDKWFNSGDVLSKDEYGYMYFKDRTGDTFRWKGENIATTEVEGVVTNIIGQKDITVYGVNVPSTEGKAGMLAIVDTEKQLDLDNLYKGLEKNLPSYARPIFVRVMEKLPFTGTFKIQKNQIQKEGYDPSKVKDPIFFLDVRSKKFIPLDEKVYEDILNNVVKL